MKDLRTIQVAEQLTKNLMWLERSNPLMPFRELLDNGAKLSERIKAQYLQIQDLWDNELSKMKTLDMILRYLVRCELDAISGVKAAPRFEKAERAEPKRARAFSTLAGRYKLDLSLAMPRGRAEILGGGSIPICTTA